ncbi:predicted protein [Streptomyces viridochromogenes DSM 40736]|uniref:Predicted protein n=1 Tax=Streptomyces viridochromogenes (strain DSM 40736 / JCM 4977 / BCRC 1201 / Tue 494) TaxID=591159 RepID=D9X5Y3_STRVT|nr:predicted protein [Streptomyces viridochromogenes DSM 40736]
MSACSPRIHGSSASMALGVTFWRVMAGSLCSVRPALGTAGDSSISYPWAINNY